MLFKILYKTKDVTYTIYINVNSVLIIIGLFIISKAGG